ncbi:MAG: YkvA family protein [Chloroflexota bacterium]|nr:YkvA family protein [Chloroflexota bacterium]
MAVRHRLRTWARELKIETYALALAARDPRVPWYARLFMALVVAYALSPLDLVPDFVPILGYLDDLILVPLGIWLALRMVPTPIMAECRARAAEATAAGRPTGRVAVVIVVAIWITLALLAGWLVVRAVE